ncbi:MAG: GntR family transcriptional regulator [Victivallaceae bacterium]
MKKFNNNILRENHQLLHRQITDILLKEYHNGNVSENTSFPSVRELARKFSTSKVTIDKALKELKKDGIIYSISGLGTFWGKKKNITRTKTVGICFKENKIGKFGSPYFYSMLEGIEEVFTEHDLNIKLLRPDNLDTIENIRETHCDAFICLGTQKTIFFAIDSFKKFHIPYLLLDRPCDDEALNYLERDSADNIQDIVKYLVACGHRKICCIGYATDLWIDKKLYLGFEAGMKKYHLRSRNAVFQAPFDFTYEALEKIKLAEAFREHTALIILTPNVPSINIILKYCANNNIRIPDDCSIVSLAQTDEMIIRNKVVTCHLITPFEMGVKAANGIVGLLNNTIISPLHIKFPLKIISGNTVNKKWPKIKTHTSNSVFELETQ